MRVFVLKGKEMPLKITSCDKIGKKQVYNLSMKGDNHNYILTAGIVSANSHAVFYSINSYITAYLKCNFPTAFFAAYLKNKTNDNSLTAEDDITTAKEECKSLGIKIIPPDVNRSGISYEVLDDKTIVMGLMAIKGMGDKAVEEIISNQPFDSFKNFLYKIEARVVNKSKIEALAKAGCFDSFGLSRKAVFEEGKKIKERMNSFIKKNEEIDLDNFPVDLSKEEWSKREILQYEQEVLGELVSGTIKELFPGFFTNTATLFSKLKILPDRENIITEFVVKSLLREFKIKTGKYSGQLMIKYRVADIMGTEAELTVWPTEYDKAKKFLVEGYPVRAECQISDFNGQKTIMLREIEKVWKQSVSD
jgi:DNA polymerase-3 subunit alpha